MTILRLIPAERDALIRWAFLPAALGMATLAAFLIAAATAPAMKPNGAIKTTNRPIGNHAQLDTEKLANAQPLTFHAHRGPADTQLFLQRPDRIVTASSSISPADTDVKIWNAETGKLLTKLAGHQDALTAIAASQDRNIIVSGSRDHTARVWDLKRGKIRHILRGHRDAIHALALSPDGTRLVTASADHTARIWNTRTGKLLHVLDGHRARLTSVVVTSDGATALTASRDATAIVWDIQSGRHRATLSGHTKGLWRIVVDTSGQFAATASSDGYAHVYNLATGKRIAKMQSPDGEEIYALAMARHDSLIITGSRGGTVASFEPATGQQTAAFEGHSLAVYDILPLPNDHHVATASWDGSIRIWDMQEKRLAISLDTGVNGAWSLALSPDGARLAAGYSDGTVKVWGLTRDRLDTNAASENKPLLK